MGAEIVVTRAPTVWRDRLRSYELVVDGETVTTVKSGEMKTVAVEPGKHRIWMKIDWARSSVIEIEIREDDRVLLHCATGGGLRRPFRSVTSERNSYIDLEVRGVDPRDPALFRDHR